MSNDPSAIPPERLPGHVAVIMDGNGRWARGRGQPRIAGHRAGIKAVREVVRAAGEAGIAVLTLYAFSVENWARPAAEVSALMRLLHDFLGKELAEMQKREVRLRTIGRTEDLPEDVRERLAEVVAATAGNDRLTLVLALSYGGRSEITGAARRIAEEAVAGRIRPGDLTPERFAGYLDTSGLPDPDLIIRTSGEMRISNFLLWQASYAELYVTEVLWPDFRAEDFQDALRDFAGRQRRFGRVAAGSGTAGQDNAAPGSAG